MSKYLYEAVKVTGITQSRKTVLVALADFSNALGRAYPSAELLADLACCSRATVFASLGDLERFGAVTRRRRFNDTTVFDINMDWLRANQATSEGIRAGDLDGQAGEIDNVTVLDFGG